MISYFLAQSYSTQAFLTKSFTLTQSQSKTENTLLSRVHSLHHLVSSVRDLPIDEFSRGKMDATRDELLEERAAAFEVVGLKV